LNLELCIWVARRVRAWIETMAAAAAAAAKRVARRVRAWIETPREPLRTPLEVESPAVCGRGLKQVKKGRAGRPAPRRPPCAGVD